MSGCEYQPPRAAEWLLERLVWNEERATVVGDLAEMYAEMATRQGLVQAHLWYFWQTMIAAPIIIKHSMYWSCIMLKNYLKLTVRNLAKQKLYSAINILGLALGIACFILITLYIVNELSYDRFHDNADRIYRVDLSTKWGDSEGIRASTPPPVARVLRSEFPEIIAATRIYPAGQTVVRYEEKFFDERGVLGVDSTFFDVFSFTLLQGDATTVLVEPNTLVMTDEMAAKYFGNASAVGNVLLLGNERTPFRVTGIVRKPPQTSHFDFNILTSMSSYPQVKWFDWSWVWTQLATYVVLSEEAQAHELQKKFPEVVKVQAAPAFARIGFSLEQIIDEGGRWDLILRPLTDIRLRAADSGNRLGPVGSIDNIYIFAAVALFTMMIACINFVNLSTARSTRRAKEVGVRKVLGSARSNLVVQFLTESMVFSIVASGLAVALVQGALPMLNAVSENALTLRPFDHFGFSIGLAVLALLVGVAAGCYPAFYLSSFSPANVLKKRGMPGTTTKVFGFLGGRTQRTRTTLVVFQFAMSIGLIICTLLAQQQLKFLQNRSLGFDKENIVVISNLNSLGDNTESFKQSLMDQTQIISASRSTSLPARSSFQDVYQPEEGEARDVSLTSLKADGDFLETFGLQLVQGRGFAREFSGDLEGILINETAARQFGWEEPLGKFIKYPGGGSNTTKRFKVLGVLRDFNFRSSYNPITPYAIFHWDANTYSTSTRFLAVRLHQEGNAREAMDMLEKHWHAFAPNTPFEAAFLEEDLDAQYRSEESLGRIFGIFTGLALFIAASGLLGLASYSAEQRTKEIGIRKALGAPVTSLISSLSTEFIKLVLIANVIAWPVAYYSMAKWLEGFLHRIDMGPVWFFAGGLIALLVTTLVVSFQVVRAATADPIAALRHE